MASFPLLGHLYRRFSLQHIVVPSPFSLCSFLWLYWLLGTNGLSPWASRYRAGLWVTKTKNMGKRPGTSKYSLDKLGFDAVGGKCIDSCNSNNCLSARTKATASVPNSRMDGRLIRRDKVIGRYLVIALRWYRRVGGGNTLSLSSGRWLR
jgi:hypothetical protein